MPCVLATETNLSERGADEQGLVVWGMWINKLSYTQDMYMTDQTLKRLCTSHFVNKALEHVFHKTVLAALHKLYDDLELILD